VIVHHLDIVCVPILEPKTQTPRAIYVHRPLAFSIALEWMKANALQDTDLIETTSRIERGQPIEGFYNIQARPSIPARLE